MCPDTDCGDDGGALSPICRGETDMRLLGSTALVAVLLVAGCAASTPEAETEAAPPSSAHPHGSHSAAPPSPLRAGERFLDVGLPAAYQPAAPNGGTDEYRCFLVDPKL